MKPVVFFLDMFSVAITILIICGFFFLSYLMVGGYIKQLFQQNHKASAWLLIIVSPVAVILLGLVFLAIVSLAGALYLP
jgi:hypothetical protein